MFDQYPISKFLIMRLHNNIFIYINKFIIRHSFTNKLMMNDES